ncbi:TIGR02285 family protein [Aestuariibacter halophilus]|uniref:TIGR02285 family protein n=1 Tax=Fluctibacter halophilus TaxID=226011 RepID=A0ABS8G6Y6_9ALTE|nr:TIGR02285 family protein [Aestuariibacter halophilus]MCC2616352.1 TIGR02285 family protein [Aestuariibacter halophilus]
MKQYIWPLLITFMLSSLPDSADASDLKTIYWQTYHRPPGIIVSGEQGQLGFIQQAMKLIQDELPDYEHVVVHTTLARALQDMRLGKQTCHPSLFRRPEREAYMYFSHATQISPTNRVVVTDETLHALGEGTASVSLTALLAKPEWLLGVIGGRSYGSEIDQLLAEHGEPSRIIPIQSESLDVVFRMLALGRIQYTLAYPFEGRYFNQHNPYQARLKMLPIDGLQPYELGHVACSRTVWGAKVISDINRVVMTIKFTDRYLQAMTAYWQEEQALPQFQDYYHNTFLRH